MYSCVILSAVTIISENSVAFICSLQDCSSRFVHSTDNYKSTQCHIQEHHSEKSIFFSIKNGEKDLQKNIYLHHVDVTSKLIKFTNSIHQTANKIKYICCINFQIEHTSESAINTKTVVILYCFFFKNQAVHILTFSESSWFVTQCKYVNDFWQLLQCGVYNHVSITVSYARNSV